MKTVDERKKQKQRQKRGKRWLKSYSARGSVK